MNLIQTLEVPFLPDDILIGWDRILEHETYGLNFLDPDLLDRKSGSKRRKEHISSRKLFSELIEEMNLVTENVELKKMKLGKPYTQYEGKTLHTSFSHCEDWVVCAMSSKLDIGVDCEHVDRKVNPRIFDRILDETEKNVLNDVSHLAIWAMKEAVVKCIGTGIRTSLQRFPLLKDGDVYVVNWENEVIKVVPFEWEYHQLAVAWRA